MPPRPWWLTGLLGFCLFMTFAYVPYDFFVKPVDEDQEVWLGFMLTGGWAKATEPLHGALYALGAYGLWKMRAWLHPWAALYTASVAIGMLVWGVTDPRTKVWMGLIPFAAFGGLAYALWRARALFHTRSS
jgi:hypothetical protein